LAGGAVPPGLWRAFLVGQMKKQRDANAIHAWLSLRLKDLLGPVTRVKQKVPRVRFAGDMLEAFYNI